MRRVVLLAAGGLAREALSSIRQAADLDVVGVLDDNPALHGQEIGDVPILGGIGRAADMSEDLIVCAGSGKARAGIIDRLWGLGVRPERFTTHIDRSVIIGDDVSIGEGSIILAGCVLTCDIVIGAHVVLMPRVVLTHDDFVGDFATLTAGATVGGRATIGRCAYVGMNATVRQDLSIGDGAVLGMGAVLVKDLPPGQVWAGTPAGPLAARTGITHHSPVSQEATT